MSLINLHFMIHFWQNFDFEKNSIGFEILGSGSDKDVVTVLACGLADGTFFRPLLLMDVNHAVLIAAADGTNDEVAVAKSTSGVMDAASLLHYVREEIAPNLQCAKVYSRTFHIYTVTWLDFYCVCVISHDTKVGMSRVAPQSSHVTWLLLCCVILHDTKVGMSRVAPL